MCHWRSVALKSLICGVISSGVLGLEKDGPMVCQVISEVNGEKGECLLWSGAVYPNRKMIMRKTVADCRLDWIQRFCGREGLAREWLDGRHPAAFLASCLGFNGYYINEL